MLVQFWDEEQQKPITVTINNPLPIGGGSGGGGGMRFLYGGTDPTPEVGEPGDVYFNTQNGNLFKNNNGNWDLLMNLVGPPGPEGPQGPQGPEGPAGADGADGFPTEAQWNDLVARVEALEGDS